MFKFFVILGALYGVFVLAHETQKSWVVNFKTDIEISGENFDAVENWIVANKGVVVDKLKSNDYKVILAQMDNNIRNLFANF